MSHVMRKPVYVIGEQHSLISVFVIRCVDGINASILLALLAETT